MRKQFENNLLKMIDDKHENIMQLIAQESEQRYNQINHLES